MDLWLCKRNPLKYEWGNPHLFPGNQGSTVTLTISVCVCVYLRRRMHKQRNFLALPVQTLCGDESSCQPCWLNETDIIWPGEAAWQSLGLSSEQVPCIYNLLRTLRMETGQSRPNWTEGGRGDSVEGGAQRHLHRSCPQVLSIYFCKYESNVEGL